MEEFLNHLLQLATTVGSKIILALVVYIVGSLLIKTLIKALNKNNKLTEKVEGAVKSFALSFIKAGLYVLLVISIIGILGVPIWLLPALLLDLLCRALWATLQAAL